MELTPDQKFSKDGPFNDPVVQCDACQELLLREELQSHGMCMHCSNTRVRNVRIMSMEKFDQMKNWASEGKIDADFIKLFEVVDAPTKAPSMEQMMEEPKCG